MAKINQYRKNIYYYGRATIIYIQLRSYLKKEFALDLKFPQSLQKEYFYHSGYYNRTQQYMHANHFFGELLCLLREKPMNKKERMRFANLSACAPIFDDFFEQETDLQHIENLLQNPKSKNTKTHTEKLAVHFLNNILQSSISTSNFLKAAKNLFQAQKQSKTQKDKELSKEQLLKISQKKGGFSGLMYAYLLESSPPTYFYKTAYLLGGYGQIMDDVFDLFDDAKEGIRTFANNSTKVMEIQQIVQEQENNILDLLNKQGIKNPHFRNTLAVFGAIIQIAIQQYQHIENEGISPINCLKLERKHWIIDMEKLSNIWLSFKLSSAKMQ
ncbi:MAG: hypothetical protein B7C24_03520 [Bacteroidetes bacterium 4572_77]|nr:MAG: hypothetical protein B7C24_03520 [Bacteroidetes bacterium 4572_77]